MKLPFINECIFEPQKNLVKREESSFIYMHPSNDIIICRQE